MKERLIFLKTFPLWQIFFQNGARNTFFFSLVIAFNVLAALIEGVSFSLILVALSVLGDGNQIDLHHYPILSRPLFSNFLIQFSKDHIFTLFVVFAILFQILRSGLSYLGQIYTTRLSTNIQVDAQKSIYRQIFRFSFSCISKYKVGDLIDYANTPTTLIHPLMSALNSFLVSLFTIGALIALLVMMSVPLTLMMLSLFLTLGLLQRLIIKKIVNFSKSLSSFTSEFSKHTVQSLHGIRAIFTFNRQAQVQGKIDLTIEQISIASKKLNIWNASILPINEIIGITLVGACLVCGPYFLQEDGIPVLPLLLTFITVTYRLATRVQAWMTSFSSIAYCLGPLSRLQDILNKNDKEFTLEDGIKFPGLESEIHFNNLTLKYSEDHKPALDQVSFVIPRGKVVALVGGSGAGKSSIVDVLLRLYEPSAGSILIDGVDLNKYQIGTWRNSLGVVSQDTFIFNDSVSENIQFGSTSKFQNEIEEAAKAAGAHDFIQKMPQGYQTIVGERGYRLSGGERQRLALARALLREPEILILDEATSNLDSHSEHLIQEALEKSQKNKTVIIIAHRLSTITKADKIIVMDSGALIESGTHDELLQKKGKYSYFWKIQSESNTHKVNQFVGAVE